MDIHRARQKILKFSTAVVVALLAATQLFAQSSPLDFVPLKEAFEKREADLVFKSEAELLGLKVKYSKRLDKIIQELRATGDSKGALFVSEAKEKTDLSPAELTAAPRAFLNARDIYNKTETHLGTKHDGRLLRLRRAYIKQLKLLLATKTGAENKHMAAAIQWEIARYPLAVANPYADAGGEYDQQVVKALNWLMKNQNDDGSWGEKYPAALTGLALLSFSGHGENVDSSTYGPSIVKAINYLVDFGKKNGGMLGAPGSHLSYEHAIATYALAQTYILNKDAMTATKPIASALRKAVPIIMEGQTRGGGWVYAYRQQGIGDLSVSGWNIQALKSAEFSGHRFSGLGNCMKKARDYIDAAVTPQGLYRYQITDSHKGRLSLTGAGVLSARLLGKPMENEDKSLEAILAAQPISFRVLDTYAAYYSAQACFLKSDQAWELFESVSLRLITGAQARDGSWPAAKGYFTARVSDVKIYHTCLCTLILETSYRAARWEK